MSEYVKVANVGELPDPGKQLIEVEDRMVVLFHAFGEYFCLDDICTHDGGPLGEGEMRGHSIACPRHGAQFDIRDGKAVTMPATENTIAHHVKVEGDGIYVRINEDGDEEIGPAESTAQPSPVSSTTAGDSAAATALPTTPDSSDSAVAADVDPTALSAEGIREELKKVIDPELFVNIVDLGLIYGIELQVADQDQTNVVIDMTMTSPACPAGPQLIANCRQVIGQLQGVADVEVKIVMDPPWTPDKMSDDAKDQLGIF